MIMNFLQTRNPPILPALHQLPHDTYIANDGTESGFSSDVESLKGFGKDNKETIGELLFHFFRLYAHDFEYDKSVISVRQGKFLTRKKKGWDLTSKEGQWRLCIEEPFNTTRNLGNSVDATAFRGIHLEIRHAFDFLANGGQLEKACEQYQYPPEEKNIFKKPAPVPRPVLSHAIPPRPPRDPRNQNSMRGGRGGLPLRTVSGVSSRQRASSGATFGRNLQYMQAVPMGIPPYELVSHTIDGPFSKDAYANQLWQQWRLLGQQADAVRAQFVQNQARHEAMQAQSAATAHAHAVVQGQNQPSTPKISYLSGSPQLPGDNMMAGSYVIRHTHYSREQHANIRPGHFIAHQPVFSLPWIGHSSSKRNAAHNKSKWKSERRRTVTVPTSTSDQPAVSDVSDRLRRKHRNSLLRARDDHRWNPHARKSSTGTNTLEVHSSVSDGSHQRE